MISDLSILQMYEEYQDILQLYNSDDNPNFFVKDTDFFIFSCTLKYRTIVGDLKELQQKNSSYDFCKLKNYVELISKDNENVLCKPENKNLEFSTSDETSTMKARQFQNTTKIKEKQTVNQFIKGTPNKIDIDKNADCPLDKTYITRKIKKQLSLEIKNVQ